jgi:hypothetical protein
MSQRIKVRLVCAFIRKTLFPLIGVSLVRFFSPWKRNEQKNKLAHQEGLP